MRSNFLPLVVIAGLTLSGAAFAETTTASTTTALAASATTAATMAATPVMATPADVAGTIKKISTKQHFIVLSDGNKYHVAKGFSFGSLKVGEKVTVTYTMKGKLHEASAVKAAA